MPLNKEGTWLENPRVMLDEYLDRLRAAKPIDTLKDNPILNADSRYVRDIYKILTELKNEYAVQGPKASIDNPKISKLSDLFGARQRYLRELGEGSVLPFSERLRNWEKDSGLSINDLNAQDFGGIQHETISHHLPWMTGFSPDINSKTILGYNIPASPASPLNESFAGALDSAFLWGRPINLTDQFLKDPEGNLGKFYQQQGEYAAEMSDLDSPPVRSFLEESIRSNPFISPAAKQYAIITPGPGILPENADLALKLNEASKLVNWKFVKPVRERFENLGKVQAPAAISRDLIPGWANTEYNPSLLSGPGGFGFRNVRGLPVNETNYNRLLNLGRNLNFYAHGSDFGRYGGGNQMLFGSLPAAASVQGAVEAVRKNPSGVAGGAAMTLLNDKVAEALAKDDYKTAATEAAKDVALGAATETGLKQVAAPLARRVAPAAAARVAPYVAGAARVGIPAAVGAGLFMQGKTGSALDTLTNKAATVVPGLKADPKTDVARRAGRTISNEARYMLNSILQNKVPYLKGRLF